MQRIKAFVLGAALICCYLLGFGQRAKLAPKPPMGYMTWNFYADHITEKDVRAIADAMVTNGLVQLGYNYIFIDDGWQGGRDKKNNIIPDPDKFPSGIKALADYVHSKGIKLGIYSDAAPLTCAGISITILSSLWTTVEQMGLYIITLHFSSFSFKVLCTSHSQKS